MHVLGGTKHTRETTTPSVRGVRKGCAGGTYVASKGHQRGIKGACEAVRPY